MKINYFILSLLIVCSSKLSAQDILIRGRVINAKNNIVLSGATVKIGISAISTDKNGDFSIAVPLKTVIEKGINFSHVSYLSVHFIYQPNHFYQVELIESTTELKEVMVGAGDDIIKKAIRRIPVNYPDKPMVLKGILRIQAWRNNSEYFKSDAIIKAYIPPYGRNEHTKVAVVNNQLDTINDATLRYLKHVSNYNVVDFVDIAHNRSILNKISKQKKFDYWLVGKQVYDNHKVFVINTTSLDTSTKYEKTDATLYIDSATYAFVAADIKIYNVVRSGTLTNKVLSYRVAYEKVGKKWYLAEIHVEATSELKNQSPQTTVDFVRTEIDTLNVQQMPYKDIIQGSDNILIIDKPDENKRWADKDSLFKKAENEGKLKIVSNALLDTIRKNNLVSNPPNQKVKKPFINRLFDYISDDNIRTIYGLTRFPVLVSSQLNDVSVSINYGMGVGVDARLYKNIFVGFRGSSNFRSKKHLQLSSSTFYFSNNFVFNKNARAITLAPYAGFALISTRYQDTKIRYNSFDGGLRSSYELSHKKSVFLSLGYNSASSSFTLNQFEIQPSHYSIGVGLIFNR